MNLIAGVLGAALVLQAGGHGDSGVVGEKMKDLAFLVGQWEGKGQMQMGPGPKLDAEVKESVQFRLSGNALLIEGLGTAKTSEGGPAEKVHEAIALVTWDPKQNKYVMHAMTRRAGHVEPTFELTGRTIVWGFDTGHGQVRYTITINEKNQWVEVGDFSTDGKTWNKFFEMTLDRKSS